MRWAGRRGFADRVPGAGARGLALARSIFELELSAIGLSLRAALTGQKGTPVPPDISVIESSRCCLAEWHSTQVFTTLLALSMRYCMSAPDRQVAGRVSF